MVASKNTKRHAGVDLHSEVTENWKVAHENKGRGDNLLDRGRLKKQKKKRQKEVGKQSRELRIKEKRRVASANTRR